MSKKQSLAATQRKKDMSKALAARRLKAEQRAREVAKQEKARVQKILANDGVDREFKHKLRYCQDQIDGGRTDFVVNRRKELIEEANRRFRLALDNPK